MHADRWVSARWVAWGLAAGSVVLSACAAASGGAPAESRQSARPAGVAAAQGGLDFEYYRAHVEPIFMKTRGGFVPGDVTCASCHTFQATTPLKLEPLQEDGDRVFWSEDQSRRNFAVVSRLVTPGNPDASRLLMKPLAQAAGGARAHTGGTYWTSKEDEEWQVLAAWVRAATPPATPPPGAPLPDFEFFRQCVQPIFVNPIPNAVACAECHAGNGDRAFANRYPEGRDYWSEDESRLSYQALMQLIEPGHPEYSRFLHHPLSPDAGGDFMHNGGRRWTSKEDPEWRALASWVRGEAKGSTCPQALQFPR